MFLGKMVEKYDQEKIILPKKQDEYKIKLKEHLQELAIYRMIALIVVGLK